MAVQLLSTASQFFQLGSALGAGLSPLTFSCWCNKASSSAGAMVSIMTSTGNRNGYELRIDTGGTLKAVTWKNNSAAQSVANQGINNSTNGQWSHAAGVFTASDASRQGFVNGIPSPADIGAWVPTATPDRTNIGVGWAGGVVVDKWANGYLADIAIWIAALSATEIMQLANGTSPLSIRPGSLASYTPMQYSQRDIVRGNFWANNGTALFAPSMPPLFNQNFLRRTKGNQSPDFVSSGTTYNDSVAEAMALVDTVSGAAVFPEVLSESVTLADTVSTALARSGSISETMTLADSIDASGGNNPFPTAIDIRKVSKVNLGGLVTRRGRRFT